jgi:hypothetical protein
LLFSFSTMNPSHLKALGVSGIAYDDDEIAALGALAKSDRRHRSSCRKSKMKEGGKVSGDVGVNDASPATPTAKSKGAMVGAVGLGDVARDQAIIDTLLADEASLSGLAPGERFKIEAVLDPLSSGMALQDTLFRENIHALNQMHGQPVRQ